MSSSRVRFSLHISAHRGRRGGKEAGKQRNTREVKKKGARGWGEKKRKVALMWNKKHISYIMALDVRLNVMTMQIIQHKSIVFYGGRSCFYMFT